MSLKNNLLIIGNGGHALSCIDVIELQRIYKIIGIVSGDSRKDQLKSKYPIVGTDKDLSILFKKTKNAFIGIGFIKPTSIRMKIFNELKQIGYFIPSVRSPNSYISKNAFIGEGSIMMHNSFINAGVQVGKNCIINTGAIIEHETNIGNNSHVSTSAVVNGEVKIGQNSFIGSNSVIKEGIKIGDNCVVSAGSFLRHDLDDGQVYK